MRDVVSVWAPMWTQDDPDSGRGMRDGLDPNADVQNDPDLRSKGIRVVSPLICKGQPTRTLAPKDPGRFGLQ